MANTVITPNMNLPAPVVGVDPGPDWATNENACLFAIDSHNHTAGQGVPITPAALNINTDLSMNTNNLTDIRTSRYTSLSSAPSLPADLNETTVINGDYYFIDGSGNLVRLTQGGAPSGATGTITGLPSGTASASFAGSTFTFQSATNTPASLNVGPVTVGQPTAGGFGVTVSAAGSQAANYGLTLPAALPVNASYLVTDTSGNLTFLNGLVTFYTPTFSAGTSVSSSTFIWTQLTIDTIMIQGTFNIGAGSSGTNPMTFSLPNGYTINNTVYPGGGGTPFGNSVIFQAGNFYAGIVSYSGSPAETNLQIYSNYNASSVGGFQIARLSEGGLNNGNAVYVSVMIRVQ